MEMQIYAGSFLTENSSLLNEMGYSFGEVTFCAISDFPTKGWLQKDQSGPGGHLIAGEGTAKLVR
jgi:hypothetical protein